jgi:hypothetical protein
MASPIALGCKGSGAASSAITLKRRLVSRLKDILTVGHFMNRLSCIALAAVLGIGLSATAPRAAAQDVVDVGAAPDCPYGYYDYDPYPCAPYGYYGPEWFTGGLFIGAGPWFRGPHEFYGHVDNRFDGRRGFHGPFPNRGDRPEPSRNVHTMSNFHGNEMRDGRGHVGGGEHGGGERR